MTIPQRGAFPVHAHTLHHSRAADHHPPVRRTGRARRPAVTARRTGLRHLPRHPDPLLRRGIPHPRRLAEERGLHRPDRPGHLLPDAARRHRDASARSGQGERQRQHRGPFRYAGAPGDRHGVRLADPARIALPLRPDPLPGHRPGHHRRAGGDQGPDGHEDARNRYRADDRLGGGHRRRAQPGAAGGDDRHDRDRRPSRRRRSAPTGRQGGAVLRHRHTAGALHLPPHGPTP